MLIDIHTHKIPNSALKEINHLAFVVGKHSLGIHPWMLSEPFNQSLLYEKFLALKSTYSSSILAIGECGLDRRRAGIVNIDMQEVVLGWHMDWALEVGRPLILHCVKAEADLLKILKSRKYNWRILLHDFGGNFLMAQSFFKYDCFFSFGRRTCEVMNSLPRDRIFLETDDQTEFSIEDIYQAAQLQLKLDRKSCEELFYQNLLNFFSDLNDISPADIINGLRTGPTA